MTMMPDQEMESMRSRMLDFMASPSIERLPKRVFTPWAALFLLTAFGLILFADELYAQGFGAPGQPDIIVTIWKWLPLILFGPISAHIGSAGPVITGQLGGFALNILVSVLVMAAGTVLGIVLGLILVSHSRLLKRFAGAVTQFFRNTPWLVLLFFSMFLLPYQLHVFGFLIPVPDWVKASAALTLPIMANVAEITRGAIQSIPASQWDSAESLAFSRGQTFRLIVLPQCVKRMMPPWMNWYAILMMESSLISIVGVNEAMTLTHDALSAEGRSDLLIPMYGMLLLLFFLYCYPIARWTQALERRFSVPN
jgi:polar amino acid transport system permease protein